MSMQEYIRNMKNMQMNLLEFLDEEGDSEEIYQNLVNFIQDKKILENTHMLDSFLYLLSMICNNHNRSINFFTKVQQILQFLKIKTKIKQTYSNLQLFKIFKNNKKVLLILIKEEIMNIDKNIADFIFFEYPEFMEWKRIENKYKKRNYIHYFYPEIKPFIVNRLVYEICKEIPE